MTLGGRGTPRGSTRAGRAGRCAATLLVAAAVLPAATATAAGRSESFVLDAPFGDAGRMLLPSARTSLGDSLVRRVGGGYAVAAYAGAGVAVRAIRSNGGIDAAFGDGGTARADLPMLAETPRAIATTADGALVVAGDAEYAPPHAGHLHHDAHIKSMLAVRLTAAGALDTDFGAGGVLVAPFPDGSAQARTLAVLPDGRTVLAGTAQDGASSALLMLDRQGRPVLGFGDHGRVTLDLLPGAESVRAITRTPEGHLLLAGDSAPGPGYVVRLSAGDGRPDREFGRDGILVIAGARRQTEIDALVALPDRRAVLAGRFAGRQGLAAVTTGGMLDRSFGHAGVADVPVPRGRDADVRGAVAMPDRTIVAAAAVFDPAVARTDTVLVRYSSAGRALGRPAVLDYPTAAIRMLTATGLAAGPDGRLAVAAWAVDRDERHHSALMRVVLAPDPAPAVRRPARKRPKDRSHARRQRAGTAT